MISTTLRLASIVRVSSSHCTPTSLRTSCIFSIESISSNFGCQAPGAIVIAGTKTSEPRREAMKEFTAPNLSAHNADTAEPPLQMLLFVARKRGPYSTPRRGRRCGRGTQ